MYQLSLQKPEKFLFIEQGSVTLGFQSLLINHLRGIKSEATDFLGVFMGIWYWSNVRRFFSLFSIKMILVLL